VTWKFQTLVGLEHLGQACAQKLVVSLRSLMSSMNYHGGVPQAGSLKDLSCWLIQTMCHLL